MLMDILKRRSENLCVEEYDLSTNNNKWVTPFWCVCALSS